MTMEGGREVWTPVYTTVHATCLVALCSEDVSMGWVGKIFSAAVHLLCHARHAWAEVLGECHQFLH